MADPFSVSYGQNSEDVVLHRALADVPIGFYVEVGANDPTELSISRPFYDSGWSGIAVEPVPEFAEAFGRARPRDTVVQAAITDSDQDSVTLHVIPDSGLSTLDEGISSGHEAAGFTSRPVSVPARRLSDVLAEAGAPDDIHFMVVDTEGTEAGVLASNDWDRWRPWILVVEATRPLSTTPSHEEWEAQLLGHGYEFCLFDGISRFYVAAERAAQLRAALSYPATALDGFTPRHWAEREKEFGVAIAALAEEQELRRRTLEDLVRWRGAALSRWATAATGGTTSSGAAGHEVAHLRNELEATRATVSWRITAPLRMVQSRLRGGR